MALPIGEAYLCFVESRRREFRLEVRLTRDRRCVITAESPTLMGKLKMLLAGARIHLIDRLWASAEKDYFDSFEFWREGDNLLENYLTEHPDGIYDTVIKGVIKDREDCQRRLIVLGEMLLSPCGAHTEGSFTNPFLDHERVAAIVRILKDDLEDSPRPYFEPLLDGCVDERQGSLKLPTAAV